MKTEPTWIDKAIEWLSPERAARRMAWRMLLDEGRNVTSSHRGGVTTRLSTVTSRGDGRIGGTSLDRQSIARMRDRAARIDENNGIGSGILNRLADNVIGEGWTLQARTESNEFNAEVEEKYADWWQRKADIRGMMEGDEFDWQAYRASERDGDVGIVLIDQGGESRVQLIDASDISTPDGKWGDPNIIEGVELDAAGAPVAFNILTTDETGKRSWARVPAANFIFLPRLYKGAKQVRGPSCFAHCFDRLDQVDGYVDAVVIAARMAAIFGLIFKSNDGSKQTSGLPMLANAQGQQQKALTVENGMAKYVGREDDVVQVQAQQPMQQTPDFVRLLLRLIGLPIDMPLELVLFDFSQVNFSSARASLLQFYRAMKRRQRRYRVQVKERIYRWWISREVKLGRIVSAVPEQFWPHEWQPPAWQWVDPVSEAQGALLEIGMGVNAPQIVAGSLGRDWQTLVKLNQEANEARRAAGLAEARSTLTRDPSEPKAEPSSMQPDSKPADPPDDQPDEPQEDTDEQ